MKKLKLPLLIYIIITQQIISNSKYTNTGILPNYPYRIHLENILEKYDESNGGSIYSMLKNADPQTIQSLGEDIGKIILFGEKAIDSIRNMGISLYSDIKSLVGYSKDALFSTIGFIKNYYPQIAAPAAAAAGVVVVGVLTKSKIDDLNKYNDGIVYEIQNLIKDEKYKRIIRDKIGIYLQKVIEKGISKLNLTKYIEDFLNTDNILEKLDKKFKKKIDSLNFILLGNTGVGKSTLLN